jgi:hypothetical protein
VWLWQRRVRCVLACTSRVAVRSQYLRRPHPVPGGQAVDAGWGVCEAAVGHTVKGSQEPVISGDDETVLASSARARKRAS